MNSRKARLLLIAAATIIISKTHANQEINNRSFSPSSIGPGQTLFTKLEAEKTGIYIENPYDDPQMWTRRYREFMGGGMGSGICAGDYDGDGKVDLYVNTKTKPGRLFRNLGDWRFKDVTEEAGLSQEASLFSRLKSVVSSDETVVWGQGSTFADVNNDGLLDLYVCRNAASNFLYINQGDGTFEEEGEERGLDLADGSVVGAFADYDRDGWLDVLVVTNQVEGNEPNGRADRLFHNKGNGYFEETTQKAGIHGESFGHAGVWFDYDADQWPDLYIANDFAGHDYLYRNNRDGTFTNVLDVAAPHTPYSSMGADVADVNNDGLFDLLVADMATTTHEKHNRGLAASRGDILTTGTKEGVAPQYMRNMLLLNSGGATFREAACWAGLDATDWTWSLRFEDFDNDGWVDLHVTNGMVREANNSDLLSNMMRALSDMQRIAVIKRSPPLKESNLAYRNKAGEGFEAVTKKWGLDEVGVSFGATTADFDNDGDLDIAYLNFEGGLSVYRNDSVGQHRVQVRLAGTNSNRQGVGAIVRIESESSGQQTRTMTVARGYSSGSELVAHFGLGQDEKVDRLIVEWPSGRQQAFTDLDADRAYLVTESETSNYTPPAPKPPLFSAAPESLGLSLKDESALAIPDKEQAFIPFRTDRAGPGIAMGDIDGDGLSDIYLASTTGSPAKLLLKNKNGQYTESHRPSSLHPDTEEGPSLIFDANGDGSNDLLTTQASANRSSWPDSFQPTLHLNDGTGKLSPTRWIPQLAINAGAAIAADIDQDGDLDLFIGARSIPGDYPEVPASALLRNDGDHFTYLLDDQNPLTRVGLVKSALFRDVDRDGLPDLILALEWDYLRYFRNEGNGRFSDRTEQAGFQSGGRGWWNGLAAADLNGDGQIDFAAGNLGLNTTYKASPTQPATLLYGDFAQNGTRLLAEGAYIGDQLYPLRPLVDIGARLPKILRKFSKNNDFAKATLQEVYGEVPVAEAQRFEADNFQSGAFLSQADGSYQFSPFPSIAQIAPIMGLLAADLDGDGITDLCATQNTDTAIPRFHGGLGLLLRGHGNGTFEALEPNASGIQLPGNGRAIVAFDPDGDNRPDLFITRHGHLSECLLNQTQQGEWLKIELAGPSSNPNAIGAKLSLRLANGTERYYELGLGGGWFSQEEPCLYIAPPLLKQLTEVSVKWPNGSESRHQSPPSAGIWTLKNTD